MEPELAQEIIARIRARAQKTLSRDIIDFDELVTSQRLYPHIYKPTEIIVQSSPIPLSDFSRKLKKHDKVRLQFLEQATSRIDDKIDRLKAIVDSKRLVFFLEVHRYSIEGILRLPYLDKINALSERIDHHISELIYKKTLTEEEFFLYDNWRQELDKKIDNITEHIHLRNDTLLEEMINSFDFLSEKVPILKLLTTPLKNGNGIKLIGGK